MYIRNGNNCRLFDARRFQGKIIFKYIKWFFMYMR